MDILKSIICIFISFSSGIIIAGAVFAFIAVIGIVPRLAQKTGTEKYIKFYEEVIIVGGILGTLEMAFDIYLPIGKVLAVTYSLAVGVFIGCLAVSLAEILNVIPILARRGRLKQGLTFFMLAIAFGKLFGSLLYYFIPGFYRI